MKNLKTILVITLFVTTLNACNNSKEKEIQELITNYTTYVDSVSNLNPEQAAVDWNTITAEYKNKKIKAQSALIGIEDEYKAESEIDKANITFEAYKIKVQKAQAQKSKPR